MSIVEFKPIYSRQWFGRCFILASGSLRWGRYEILDEAIAKDCDAWMPDIPTMFGQIEPQKVASTFEDLIHIYIPDALPNYLLEVEALATLEYSRAHLWALRVTSCSVDDFLSARAAVASSFNAALTAVFQASIPLHNISGFTLVRYRRMLDGMYLADFSRNDVTYQGAFSPDLNLERIDEVSALKRVWTSPLKDVS